MGGYCGCASSRLKRSIEMRGGRADEDEKDDYLGDPGVPLVSLEDGHAEDGNHPANDCNDDDANCDGHASPTHGGEKLTADDTGDHRVTDHQDHIEQASELCGPVSHKISSHNLAASAPATPPVMAK